MPWLTGPNGASPMRGRGAQFETVLGLLDSTQHMNVGCEPARAAARLPI